MDDESPESAAELKRRQELMEHAERAEASEADNEAEAAAHLRRAEKAAYLRDKLAEQEQADAESDAAGEQA